MALVQTHGLKYDHEQKDWMTPGMLRPMLCGPDLAKLFEIPDNVRTIWAFADRFQPDHDDWYRVVMGTIAGVWYAKRRWEIDNWNLHLSMRDLLQSGGINPGDAFYFWIEIK